MSIGHSKKKIGLGRKAGRVLSHLKAKADHRARLIEERKRLLAVMPKPAPVTDEPETVEYREAA